jgi:hypothetical protein
VAVDQDLLDRIAGTVADLYREVETAIVKTVAQRLRKDLPLPSPWQEEKLDAVRQLQASAQLILARLQAVRARLIRDAVARAYRSGGEAAIADLPASWAPRSGIGQAARKATAVVPNARLLENLAQALHRDVGRVDQNILRAPIDAYRAVQAGTAARIASGTWTRREASQAAWQRLIDKGITSFTDRAGRTWRLSSYVEMMGRTNIQRAATQGQTDRLAELGIDLVYISDNVQECKICRPFESKVLRRDLGPIGKIQVEHATRDDEMVTVDVIDTMAGAMAKGLFHPNCRHSASAYLPGVTRLKKNTADPEGDKARQQQRYLERRIRAAKEQQVGALTPEAKKDAGANVRAAQAALRAHLAAHPALKRLPYREQIGAGNVPRGEAPGGPVGDLQPPAQPDPDAAAKASAERQAAELQAAELQARQEAEAAARKAAEEQAAAEEKARKEAEEAARQAAIEQAKREAAEAARKAIEQARREAEEQARREAPGMREGLRHYTNRDGLAWAKKDLPLPADLTDAEREALKTYTGSSYSMVNRGLRGDLPPDGLQARYEQIIRDLDSAFAKSRLPDPVVVHRGLGKTFAEHLGADVDKPETMEALVGKVFTEQGFMSSSVGRNATFNGKVYLMIRVPRGYEAVNVMPISVFDDEEREVVVRRDARYVVHAAYKVGPAWHVEVEIVPDGWTRPAGWTPDAYGDGNEGYRDGTPI